MVLIILFALVLICGASAYIYLFIWLMLKEKVRIWSKAGFLFSFLIGFFLSIISSAIHFMFCAILGGGAGAGKIVGDRYFLGDHGKYTEVSKSTWELMYWWDSATKTAAPFFFICFLLTFWYIRKHPIKDADCDC